MDDLGTRTLSLELRSAGTATIFAAHPSVQVLPGRIRRMAGIGCAGRVRTVVLRPGDNFALHHAISLARSGDLLVAVVDGDVPGGYFGEIMALACRVKGIAGVVLDATVRDLDELRSLEFPVFATGISLRDTTKRCAGEPLCGVDIEIDGLTIRDADWIVADGSAIVHVPQTALDEVVRNARRRSHREESMRAAVLRGVPTVELLARRSE